MLYCRRASENFEFDKITITAAHDEKSVDWAKLKQFQLEDPSPEKKLSNNTLVEEMKPVLMEKVEEREMSKLITFLWTFLDYQDSEAKINIHQFSTE